MSKIIKVGDCSCLNKVMGCRKKYYLISPIITDEFNVYLEFCSTRLRDLIKEGDLKRNYDLLTSYIYRVVSNHYDIENYTCGYGSSFNNKQNSDFSFKPIEDDCHTLTSVYFCMSFVEATNKFIEEIKLGVYNYHFEKKYLQSLRHRIEYIRGSVKKSKFIQLKALLNKIGYYNREVIINDIFIELTNLRIKKLI
jgi:hypothetical protein